MFATARRLSRRVALLASFLLLAGSCMPLLAQVLGGEAGKAWAEVCTAQGMKKVLVSGAEAADDTGGPLGSAGAPLDHCVFCSFGAGQATLPPPVPQALLPLAGGTTFPDRYWTAPHTPHAWCPAQPRAPPAQG